MNQSKFSLADVLTVLAALAFGFVCFLGTNFFTLGNTGQSIILAVVIAVLLGGLAFGAKLLKRTSRNFKTCFVWEIVLLVLFAFFAIVFANSPFPHYFVVSKQKADIQSKLSASITQAENMFAGYERYAETREKLYKSKLRSVAAAKSINPSKYAECGFENNGIADNKQIDNKMFTLHADLFPTNYSDTLNQNGIKEVAITWLSDSKKILANPWSFNFGAVEITKNVEKNSNKWLGMLTGFSSVREPCEQAEDFVYDLSFDDVKNHFTTLGKPTTPSVCWALLAYALMLLSYLISKRHSRFPGFKFLFATGKAADNEL
jgi:energy-coupling factor transporter transmembrane protein EcfT